MNDLWIAPERIFDGGRLLTGHAVRIFDGHIAEITEAPRDAVGLKGCLSPGFVDLQVNGGGGIMLNTTPTREGMAAIAAAHRRFGTVAIMPTVITDAPYVLDRAADAAIAAHDEQGIVGLHIEGPHISSARRGTHAARYIRQLDARTMDLVARLRRSGVTVMITLAPEAATPDQIAALTEIGAIVSIGHTDADARAVEAAIRAGAQCATHLFNAMSPMTGRAPGAVGTLLNSTVRAGIICDSHHVDDRMIALALRARPAPDLTFLVSDAMATVGGPDRFTLYGQDIHLMDGRLVNSEGNLAGAHVTQAEGVARLVNAVGIDLAAALRMAITIPAQTVGRPQLATVAGRAVGDLVIISDDARRVTALRDAEELSQADATRRS